MTCRGKKAATVNIDLVLQLSYLCPELSVQDLRGTLQPNMRTREEAILFTVPIQYHKGLSVPLARPYKATVVCVFVVVDQVRYP